MFGRHRLRAICAPVMRCIGFVAGHFDWNCTGVVARRHVKRATEKTCWWGGMLRCFDLLGSLEISSSRGCPAAEWGLMGGNKRTS